MTSIDPIDDPLNYKYGIFYFNRSDIRTVVPKRSRVLGFSLNFASWKSYIFLLMLVVVVVYFA
jgi:uncharacterized membrane protein